MRAGYAVFQLGVGPWYGYWYGVILQVVEGISTEFEDVRVNRILLLAFQNEMTLGRRRANG